MKMFLTPFCLIWTMGLAAGVINAQDQLKNTGPIAFYVDASAYKMFANPDSTYWQLHGYVDRRQFRLAARDSGYGTAYSGRLILKERENDRTVYERSWHSGPGGQIAAADTASEVPLLFELNCLSKPGKYILRVELRDETDTSRIGISEGPLELPSYAGSSLSLSDVQVASQVQKGGASDAMFVKNGFTVIPNPSRLFGTNLPRLFMYAEVYNLEFTEGRNDTYRIEFIVTDEAGSVIKEYPAKTVNKVGTTAVILNSINVLSLVTGRYQLLIRVTDAASGQIAYAKEAFIVYREGESVSELSSEGDSFFSQIDEHGLERASHIVTLIGSDDERRMFKNIRDTEGQKRFLDKFWKDRDPSPGTKANEALMDYYTRYEKANQQFSSQNRPGWKTDMGRVYVMYGPPAQVEKHDFEPNLPPYQIWYYLQLKNQPTQTIFVFADKSGTSVPVLVHSNARGEYNNTAWMDELRRF